MSECFVCNKHRNLNEYTGDIIAESAGLVLTHFPKIADQKISKGHLLIEPRRHITDLTDLDSQEAAALGSLIRVAVCSIKSQLNAEHVYLFRINDQVPHLHFHLIPRYPNTPREYWGLKIFDWPGRETLELEQINTIVQKLREGMIT